MANILSDLNIDPTLIVVNIVGFGALYAIAKKLVFDPIGTLLTSRETEIASTYDRLDADQREMQRLKSDYESRLESIESEAREKISSAIKEAQATRDKIVSDATAQAREIVSKAEADAEREREQAMITLRQQIVDLALGATTKVVGESLDADRHGKLIDEYIAKGVAEA
ncbi:MAG: F0F1 ATP synthase subunit B [Armatimonadetes bacterium]|jgi:F-type H+-transporting ATPase subunit b|nr:F0F1 ATP synthase subunit B [Armatimonadota bacterium]